MGLRMRKSFKIMPGLRLNVSKSGISATVGKSGACVNLSSRGARATVGVPGTGISYSTKLGGKKQKTPEPLMDTSIETPVETGPKPKRPVSWFGKIGLWFVFLCCFSPIMEKGAEMAAVIILAASIGCTWLLVRWINKKRREFNSQLVSTEKEGS